MQLDLARNLPIGAALSSCLKRQQRGMVLSSIDWRSLPLLQVLALVLASCSSSETVEQQSKLAASTAEAAVLVTDAWLSGAAPSHYASAALQSFAGTLGDAGRQVESASSSDPAKRDALKSSLSQLSNAASRAESAVKAEQRAQAAQAVQELRAGQADLATAYRQYFAPRR
ncbi:hypothetical protein [Mesorhizobium sp.]|uniref:hypothetical protein n=2 Tax=Mesorhizobium sp. TaxID=1871066 RepID=UPI000FE9BAED|nr:hypothetical protein [Mesorhizobium sp.]RWM24636.1 MAG: hypothetical protein EOR74_23340 [Mesorhizobium sp.]RWM40305.1 MAG: hypothetical protein EOR75_10665 [Mesorhizobium sp.]TIO77191.1 MAG: hypothetical protein E5X75_12140 [Mesorhizobium sp.]